MVRVTGPAAGAGLPLGDADTGIIAREISNKYEAIVIKKKVFRIFSDSFDHVVRYY
jgi:hypothetical protein